jgi:hypothetical protein
MIRKCQHGVYNPDLDTELAWGCGLCYPAGHEEAPAPVLPRSSGIPLKTDNGGILATCGNCGDLILYSTPGCEVCIPLKTREGREQLNANQRQPGQCPNCGSTVHYTTAKTSEWLCADCEQVFPAPRKKIE